MNYSKFVEDMSLIFETSEGYKKKKKIVRRP